MPVDTAYKSDLREVNELSYARSDARRDHQIAELRADMRSLGLRLQQRVREQTKLYFLAWLVLLASNIALWFR